MNNIAGIPYVEAEFDKNGKLISGAPTVPAGTEEVIVFSHGWNNNHEDARKLYTTFFTNYAPVAPSGKKQCIVGILWPAKKLDDVVAAAVANAQASGGPAAGQGGHDEAAADQAIFAQLDEVQKLLGPDSAEVIAKLKELVPDIKDSQSDQRKFVDLLRGQLTSQDTAHDEEPSSSNFLAKPGTELLKDLSKTAPVPEAGAPKPEAKTSEGGSAGFLDNVFGGIKGGIIKFVNLFSYFEMKERAGTVGAKGVAELLNGIGKSVGRIHLIGHSFGGRVVTAAAKATGAKISSMSLLQAAFSHNGFQPEKGFFRSVVEESKVSGPIVITHTFNDSAVGIAYPAASLISGTTASGQNTANLAAAVGGPKSPFGGLGSNGALNLAKENTFFIDMVASGKTYSFSKGKVYNLEASPFISEHGDVDNKTVAYAVASAHKI